VSRSAWPWHPTTIRRFIKSFPTSACTGLVETDAGPGYLKALGNREGPHILACEWVGTQLARWLGLSTFDFALINVTPEDEIPFAKGGQASEGRAFITRAETGGSWSGHARQLRLLANPQDITRLVVFDTWTLNCDRHSYPPKGDISRTRVNRDNVFLSEEAPPGQFVLKAIDHTHCFTCGAELTQRLRAIDRIKDERVFGRFFEFRPYLDRTQARQAARHLRRIDRSTVGEMTQTIPTEWEVSSDVQEALVDLIVGRAVFVADTIERKLWLPRLPGLNEPEETEHPS
jgi:hypothetical protein